MKAVITGGTSGIGKCLAQELDQQGYELVIVGSRPFFDTSIFKSAEYISCDLSSLKGAAELLSKIEKETVDVFIDNAGYGDIGSFLKTDTEKEMTMIDLNCKSLQFLLKEMMKKMVKQNKGRILVTSSIAAFAPAPYMATYYATKVYDYHLALGYSRELHDLKSPVTISVLCPGPVATGFEKTANAVFSMKPAKPEKIASIAIKGLLKGKMIIIPTLKIKMLAFLSKITPVRLSLLFTARSARIRNQNS